VTTVVERFDFGKAAWTVKCGNILDEPADVLICSANVSLNLSGGVGADLLQRYGPKMQAELHKLIAKRSPRAAMRGEVIEYVDEALPYRAILHAVAVDGWYESTPKVIQQITALALVKAKGLGARNAALTALATGFGNLSLEQFAEGVRPLLSVDFDPVKEVCICLMEDYRATELAGHLKKHVGKQANVL
jgi:O-acetyl-ADP-ribose deacetylase